MVKWTILCCNFLININCVCNNSIIKKLQTPLSVFCSRLHIRVRDITSLLWFVIKVTILDHFCMKKSFDNGLNHRSKQRMYNQHCHKEKLHRKVYSCNYQVITPFLFDTRYKMNICRFTCFLWILTLICDIRL